MHTLHSYIVERADGTVIAGATPGGRGQIQTNLQVLVEIIDRGSDLAQAIDRPRWVHGMPRTSATDDTVYIEAALAEHGAALAARGPSRRSTRWRQRRSIRELHDGGSDATRTPALRQRTDAGPPPRSPIEEYR